jgi:hypothetical protein
VNEPSFNARECGELLLLLILGRDRDRDKDQVGRLYLVTMYNLRART